MIPFVLGFSVPPRAASNSSSGTAARSCEHKDCSFDLAQILWSLSVRCNTLRLLPELFLSGPPFAIPIAVRSCPALRRSQFDLVSTIFRLRILRVAEVGFKSDRLVVNGLD